MNIDDVKLPFEMPAPKYKPEDRPATAQAIREALTEAQSLGFDSPEEMDDISDDDDDVNEDEQIIEVSEEGEDARFYAEMLWNQVFCS